MKMIKEELINLFDELIYENGLVGKFNDFLDLRDYTEEEYDQIISEIEN